MYWVSHVTPDQNQPSAVRALESFLNDEAEEIAEIVHISAQYAPDEPAPFSNGAGPPEPVGFVVVLKLKESAVDSGDA